MPTAVFVRHTHPVSQGNHSYSVALVKYQTQDELQALIKFFGYSYEGKGLPEPWGHSYQWYGGNCFDLVATFPGDPDTLAPLQHVIYEDIRRNRHSVGDNRWVGYYTAEELLGTPEPEEDDEDLTNWCGCDCEPCMDGRCGQGDCEHAYD